MLSQIGIKQTRQLAFAALFQLIFNIVLCGWWGYSLLKLASMLGEPDIIEKTRSLVFWEGAWFTITSIFICTLIIALVWRDQQRKTSMQVFFASLTHELKTPLTSLRLQAELIDDSNPKNAARRNQILLDADRLERQVNQCLELAKSFNSPSKAKLTRLPSNLLENELSQTFSGLNVSIRLKQATLFTEPTQLKLVLSTLVDNSYRHNSSKKDLIVTIDGEVDKDSTSGYKFKVSDNGKGVSEQDLALLQGNLRSRELHASKVSTGLGLYLAQRLCDQLQIDFRIVPHSSFAAELLVHCEERNQ